MKTTTITNNKHKHFAEIILKDDNGKALPKKVQKRVNDFIDNLKDIPWFKPSPNLKKEDVDKQVEFTLECFGVKAEIEYRSLKTQKDWNSARDSAWNSAWRSARNSAWNSAWDLAWNSAWRSARNSAWSSAWDLDSAWEPVLDSAWDSAWAATEVLLQDNEEFKKKYPNGAFIQLFKLWEMGLYPVGVLAENKKFVIYVPPCNLEFPSDPKN